MSSHWPKGFNLEDRLSEFSEFCAKNFGVNIHSTKALGTFFFYVVKI